MKILITGSSGRVGRCTYIMLMRDHDVIGVDAAPSSTTDVVADIRDKEKISVLTEDVDAIVHCAALHAPHVNLRSDDDFISINVDATVQLVETAAKRKLKHVVFTSTTALYGYASTPKQQAGWVTESTDPKPRTVYHRSKIQAEQCLSELSKKLEIPVTVLQMSRCFPEPVNQMAAYRLHRGVDVRDVASAHMLALQKRLPGFCRFIVSGNTPFLPDDCKQLREDSVSVIEKRCPELKKIFVDRGWQLPTSIDRVYDASAAQSQLQWQPRYGFEDVVKLYDQGIPEILPEA